METTAPRNEQEQPRRLISSALGVALIGVVVVAALFAVWRLTQEQIERNQRAWIEQPLEALLEPVEYDNDLLSDAITVMSRDLLGSPLPTTVFRARRNGEPAAAVIHAVAPDGYRGPIDLLVAIAPDGTLIGVQVIQHNETPGLGDQFETREADWLASFRGLSLSDPPQRQWTVRRDGGAFDAFTGATITPRAIVKAVRRTLEYYRTNRAALFRETPDE